MLALQWLSVAFERVIIIPALGMKWIGYRWTAQGETYLLTVHADRDALHHFRREYVALLYVDLVNRTRGQQQSGDGKQDLISFRHLIESLSHIVNNKQHNLYIIPDWA